MATSPVHSQRFEDNLPIHVFIVSPNNRLCQELQQKLDLQRWQVSPVGSGAGALQLLRNLGRQEGILLLDPVLPDLDANEFGLIMRERYPHVQILTMNSQTGQLLIGNASPTPVSCRLADEVNCGSPLSSSASSLREAAATPRDQDNGPRLRGMIGDSECMRRMGSIVRMVAPRNTTVLITGESGTGKDLLAQEVHLISSRRNQPFVVVNCSAIPEALLEAELFGYVKGSFTGAVQSRIGRIHAAHGGTLFLDEIGDMPLSLQSKILRFLEQGEVQRLGGNDNLKVDVRVLAATNADLKKMVGQQQFREDLYYRLAVFPIHLPPLRDRMEDIGALARTFVAKMQPGVYLGDRALDVLRQHSWPGNVRELRNAMERATILVGDGPEITPEHILI